MKTVRKILAVAAVVVASVACDRIAPTEPTAKAEVTKPSKRVTLPLPASINWGLAKSLAAASGCDVYALGASGGSAIFVSCAGEAPRQVAQSEICLPYSDGSFAGACEASPTCTSTGQIGAYGPIYTGSCDVP
jgi:hypothetical protein